MAEPAIAGHGHRVRLQPMPDVEPAGLWRCLDRAPHPGEWWVQPADSEARAWLTSPRNVLGITQGCVSYPSRLMAAPDVLPLF